MGPLKDEDVARIRARYYATESGADRTEFNEWLSQFDVHASTISNILNDRSYRRSACYPAGSKGRTDAEQREREWQAIKKRRQQMRYISATKRNEVLERDGYRCVYCSADLHNEAVAIDHRVPVSAGGTNDIDNLQATCKTCNARKKDFTGPESGIREYLDRRRQIDRTLELTNKVLTPIIEGLAWADSEEATCPWCNGKSKQAGEIAEFPSRGFVWRCPPCRRYFTVDSFTESQDFLSDIGNAIWGNWYAGEEAIKIVTGIVANESREKVAELVATMAGDFVEVKKKRHHHGPASKGCWCEYGLSEFTVTGRPIKQMQSQVTANGGQV